MVRTRVGEGHGAEVVQVDFDPQKLSYNRLLDYFWSLHNPCASNQSRLYARVIMVHNQDQRTRAQASLAQQQRKRRQKITTLIEPMEFHLARNSDQKYFLRRSRKLFAEMSRHYPTAEGLLHSTAAARLNGYLGGNGTRAQLRKELPSLGLSESSQKQLR